MLDIYVDASLGRPCGAAGVVFRSHGRHADVCLSSALPPGLTVNEAEIYALVAAAQAAEQVLPLLTQFDPETEQVAIRTDSQVAVRALLDPSAFRSERLRAAAKTAARYWCHLRDDRRLFLGWSLHHIARNRNPADAAARAGFKLVKESFTWRKAAAKKSAVKTSGPSSPKTSAS